MFFEQPDTMGIIADGLYDIGNIDGGTVYASDSGGSWWDNWGDNIFGIGSQIIGAWGRNPTQQIGTVPGVGGGYSPQAILSAQAQQQAAIAAQQQALLNARGGTGQNGTNSLDGIFGSITSTISNNPLIFAAGAVGLFLFFREPPRGRR